MGNSLTAEQKSWIVDDLFGEKAIQGNPVDVFAKQIGAIQDIILSDDHYMFCQEFLAPKVTNSLETHNLEMLLHYTWAGLDHAVCNRKGTELQTLLCASLRACHNIVRLVAEAVGPDASMLLKFLDRDGISTKIVNLLIDFLVQVPLDSTSSRMHCEVLLLLMTYFSTCLHHSPEYNVVSKDIYVELALNSEMIESLCLTLMQRIVAWGNQLMPTSQYFYVGGHTPSLWNMYYLFGTVKKDKRVNISELLGRLSLQTLLILTFYMKGVDSFPQSRNAALESVANLSENEQISFQLLLAAINSTMEDCPESMMLFYLMVYDHPTFFQTCLQNYQDEFQKCVAALLHQLSEGKTEAVQHMAATALLIISQDASLMSLTFTWSITPQWFTARKDTPKFIGKCLLGSLAIVCLSKIITKSLMSKRTNNGLASVCVGVLANMAPFVHHIEPYPAQRLIALLTNLIKKASKLLHTVQENPDAYSLHAELQFTVETTVTLVEIIFVTVSGNAADKQNYPLLYEVLYHANQLKEVPTEEQATGESSSPETSAAPTKAPPRKAGGGEQPLKLHPMLQEALAPVLHIASFYEAELASVSDSHTSDEIINLIKRVSEDGSVIEVVASAGDQTQVEMIKKDYEDLFFSYEEAVGCYVFFGPFLWQNICAQGKDKRASTFMWVQEKDQPQMLQSYVRHAARRSSEDSIAYTFSPSTLNSKPNSFRNTPQGGNSNSGLRQIESLTGDQLEVSGRGYDESSGVSPMSRSSQRQTPFSVNIGREDSK